MTDSAEAAYKGLIERLRLLRRRETVFQVLTGLCVLVAFGVALTLLLILLEAVFYLGPATKLLLEVGGGVALLGLTGRLVLYPLFSPPTLEALALRVESHFGGLEQRLISVLQLWKGKASAFHSTELIEAAAIQTEKVSEGMDLSELVDRSRPFRAAIFFAAMLLLALGAFGFWPSTVTRAAMRLGNPRTAYDRPADTQIDLRPGSARVIAGEPFEIEADLAGVVPTECQLLVRQTEMDGWTPIELAVRRSRAAHRFGSVTRAFSYRLQANDAETPVYRVAVITRPRVIATRLVLRYPPYTGLSERVETEERDVAAPSGTVVNLTVEASRPLMSARLDFADGERLPGRIEAAFSEWQLEVDRDRRYKIVLRDSLGTPNRGSSEYRIAAIQDRRPEVKILQPRKDSELDEKMRVPLLVEAYDDYGVSRMEIRYRISDREKDRTLPIALGAPGAREMTEQIAWDLSEMDLLPGDVVSFLVRVWDNNDVSGPGMGESRRLNLRFPSLVDFMQEAARSQDEGIEELERIQEASRDLQEHLEQAERELAREARLEWQERKELETGVEAQRELGKRIERVVQKLEETLERLEKSGFAAVETLEKLQEVRELLSQVESPALKKAAQALQKALEDVDRASVREAIESFQAEGEAFRRNLDRTIALLKRLRQEQILDGLVHATEKLAEGQEDLVRRLDGGADVVRQADREDFLRQDAERVRDELARAASEMAETQPTGEELNRIASQFEEKAVPGRMAEVSRQLRQGSRASAGKLGQEISKDVRDLGQRLREVRQTFQNRRKSEVAGELKRALRELISLSHSQEDVSRQAEDISRGEDTAPLGLKQARILSGASRTAERLLQTSGKTFFVPAEAGAALGNALLKMGEAAHSIENRQSTNAERRAREAMGALNTTGLVLRQAIAELASAASALGFEEMMEKLGELAEQQGGVNARTEGLASRAPGAGALGPGLDFQQLAAEQLAIQEALDALWRKLGAERQKVVGDMGQVASEMGSVARALEQGRPSAPVLKRQERILSRMLDAQRSLRKQGWSKKREARQGLDLAYRGPGTLPADLGASDNPLRERLQQALNEGFPPEYHQLIRRYFENLIEEASRRDGNP